MKTELNELTSEGVALAKLVAAPNEATFDLLEFGARYQHWYTAALAIVRQLATDRLQEFEEDYHPKPQKDGREYGVYHWVRGTRQTTYSNRSYEWEIDENKSRNTVIALIWNQTAILRSLQTRLDRAISDVRAMLQADLFATELDAATYLHRQGHLRAAGAVAGVVLESHLKETVSKHGLRPKQRHPTISDFNQLLFEASVIDQPTWRQIGYLADIRNLCDHAREREPQTTEVEELLAGTKKHIANIA